MGIIAIKYIYFFIVYGIQLGVPTTSTKPTDKTARLVEQTC